MVEGRGDDTLRWGTWEELILGGAVLRHGSQNWDAVASELQTRTLYPYLFTPQVCKAKYKVLQECNSDCSSLETKLETLKSEKAVCSYAGHGCSAAESLEPLFKSGENGCAGKEVSQDGSSAGSFTQEIQTIWLPQYQAAVTTEAAVEESDRKPVVLNPSIRLEKFPSLEKLAETMLSEHGVNIRKRRGKRRRKELNKDGKEGSVGENNLKCLPDSTTTTSQAKENLTSGYVPPVISPDAKELNKEVKEGSVGENNSRCLPDSMTTTSQVKENVTSGYVQPAISPDANDQIPCTSQQDTGDFVKILDSIMENEHASVFRRRLDSQKRARYKRIIRQHMDLDTIRSRIANNCITSTVELLRDLLLLANNALVFYSKCTREYKCGLVFRDLVTKILHQHYKENGTITKRDLITKVLHQHYKEVGAAETPKSPMRKPPAKPRSVRPFNCKVSKKAENNGQGSSITVAGKESVQAPRILSSPCSAESTVLTKKTQGKRGKGGRVRRGNAGIQAETPMKVRKRAKVK
ncbi:uncharacterized protein [Spinacia oleracea]|uniref:Uncharacterized protein isoform X2 n=1 Tax=Spinacia oleracea TaxID=3562 RepID=A0A9R0K318_SPIOL|nr:uncharacterized protein LOC110795961 isoform X2 [Spinacia oleracea]